MHLELERAANPARLPPFAAEHGLDVLAAVQAPGGHVLHVPIDHRRAARARRVEPEAGRRFPCGATGEHGREPYAVGSPQPGQIVERVPPRWRGCRIHARGNGSGDATDKRGGSRARRLSWKIHAFGARCPRLAAASPSRLASCRAPSIHGAAEPFVRVRGEGRGQLGGRGGRVR